MVIELYAVLWLGSFCNSSNALPTYLQSD